MKKLGHLPALDGLRGVAILLVLGVHAYAPVFPGGSSGVDLFFVLSGFLITKLAYEEHDRTDRLNLGAFYTRRAFRLLPALLLLLAVLTVMSYTNLRSIGHTVHVETVFALGFVSNLIPIVLGTVDRPTLGHTWSLALEEQFYWVWPVLLVSVSMAFKRPREWAKWVLIVAFGLEFFGRIVVAGILHYPHWAAISIFNLTGLALGCALAIYVHTAPTLPTRTAPPWAFYGAWAVVIGDFLLANHYLTDGYDLRKEVVRVLFALILLSVVNGGPAPALAVLSRPSLRFFGRISYSLYLWHIPVFFVLSSDRYPAVPRIPLFAVRIAVAMAAALLSYHFVEQPALRFRKARLDRRFRPVPGSATPIAAVNVGRVT